MTEDGIKVSCLLNPRILVGRLVRINNKDIIPALVNVAYTAINTLPRIADDGLYRVYVVEYEGDNRGNPWYSHLTCLAANASAAGGPSIPGGT